MSREPKLKIERTYKTTITYTCPRRGLVAQEVEVKVYPSAPSPDPTSECEEIAELLDGCEPTEVV